MALMISRRTKILALVLGSFLTAAEYWNYRSSQMMRLYSTSVSPSATGPVAESAIRQLNGYVGSQPKDLLVKIATADRDFIDGRQDFAIHLLIARRDTNLTRRIAVLLQPSIGLARREAVAAALQNAVCDDGCTRFILHYLERRWAGYGISEDITSVGVHFDSPAIEKEQSQVVAQLNRTLATNPQSTLAVLRDTYGLGSPAPSAFSVYVLTTVRLREGCPFLEASKQNLIVSSKSGELDKTFRELGCDKYLAGGNEGGSK
jgi:hypothetical protein